MSGLYIHIPFCKRICAYCDFFKCADLRSMPAVTEAMHLELEEENRFIGDRQLQSIYFGGGTPSLLEPDELQRFIDRAARLFDTSRLKEITVEVNPDDINAEYIAALRRTAVNRISIGIQSFDERLLRLMNRRHTGLQAEEAVRTIQEAGYGNVTADLIFGIDGFADERLESDIERLLGLCVQHISAYHLTIEPDTRFGRMAARGEFRAVDEEQSEHEFRLIHDRLAAAGFEHYEVSNYARAGYRSLHNSSYWTGAEYLGIGPGAHSYNGSVRRWCEQPTSEYVHARKYGEEHLDDTDRYNELVMTSLRRVEGVGIAEMAERFGAEHADTFTRRARELEGYGVVVEGGRVRIPPEKMLVSDAVISELFEMK